MSTTLPARTGRAWAYLGTITGGAVSIAANIAHTYVPPKWLPAGQHYSPQLGAVVGAVFWPSALFMVIEILARVPWPKGTRWVLLRFAGLGPVAVVAAIVSYRHLSALLTYYGEDTITHMIGPLAVDGLMVMATSALIATGTGHPKAVTIEDVTADLADTAVPDVTGTEASETTEATARPVRKRPAGKRAAKPSGVRSDGAVTKAAVADLMSANPQMSTTDMAEALNLSDRTVRRHVAALGTSAA
jgi:hypothetical protein